MNGKHDGNCRVKRILLGNAIVEVISSDDLVRTYFLRKYYFDYLFRWSSGF